MAVDQGADIQVSPYGCTTCPVEGKGITAEEEYPVTEHTEPDRGGEVGEERDLNGLRAKGEKLTLDIRTWTVSGHEADVGIRDRSSSPRRLGTEQDDGMHLIGKIADHAYQFRVHTEELVPSFRLHGHREG
jgi:hypothetical protein